MKPATPRKERPSTTKPAESRVSPAALRRYELFAREYIVDMNGTQAAIRTGYSPKSADVQASVLLGIPKVQELIAAAQKARADRTGITADRVLQRMWDIATADPNELIQYRRLCCRRCHGIEHEYQYRDRGEFNQATAAYLAAAQVANIAGKTIPFDAPSDSGGYGYLSSAQPNPECPACEGEGSGEPFIEDTRKLSTAARALYAGVKITKDGLQVLTQDQGKHLEMCARHLGMFNDKLTLKGDAENPLTVLLRNIGGKSALGVVPVPPGDDE